MTATLQFPGAVGTVTGSMHLVRAGDKRVVLDCGRFQGLKELRLWNWTECLSDPRALDAIVLSHERHRDAMGRFGQGMKAVTAVARTLV